jgi:DNA modification methylase
MCINGRVVVRVPRAPPECAPMDIELWPLDQITPYPGNPRVNDAAVEAVAASLDQFGWRQPLVIDPEGVLIVGHTRLKAAMKLGWTQAPVHIARDLDPVKARAYRLADNQTATIAEWDMDLLPVELKELEELDFDLSLLGWPEAELSEIMAPPGNPGLTDPDEVPEPPDEAVTQPGDLWLLGEHRLLCGDSSSAEYLDRLLDGELVHLVVTDPPYGVAVSPRSRNAMSAGNSTYGTAQDTGGTSTTKRMRPRDRAIQNDDLDPEQFALTLRAWFGSLSRALVPGRSFYIFGGYSNLESYPGALRDSELHLSQPMIWHKQHPVIGRRDFMSDYEMIFYGWKEGAAHGFFGPNNISDLWSVKKVSPRSMVHLTEKPVELAARAMSYSSRPGERVLDLFGGSGSTLIACEQQGRRALVMELDGPYCDVIVQRWQAFTGKKAQRTGANGRKKRGIPHESAPARAGAEVEDGDGA